MEETVEVGKAIDVPEVKPFDWTPLAPDYFLRAMVDLVNKTNISFDVTLTVDGFLVSGHLVSGKAYFEGVSSEMADAFKKSAAEEASESIRSYFLSFGNVYDNIQEDPNRPLPVFIHLKGAKFFHNSGAAIPKNRGIWWRGRISCVSGFCMGSLGAGG